MMKFSAVTRAVMLAEACPECVHARDHTNGLYPTTRNPFKEPPRFWRNFGNSPWKYSNEHTSVSWPHRRAMPQNRELCNKTPRFSRALGYSPKNNKDSVPTHLLITAFGCSYLGTAASVKGKDTDGHDPSMHTSR